MGLSKKHWQWIAAFAAGTFLGGWVLGTLGGIAGGIGIGRKKG